MIRQSLDGAVMEQHPAERTEPTLGANALPQFAVQSRGDLGQEILHRGVESFMEGLLGIGHLRDQANDGGDPLQGKRGFGGRGNEGEQEIRQRDFPGRALEEPGLPGHGLGVQSRDLTADLLEVGRQRVRQGRRAGS